MKCAPEYWIWLRNSLGAGADPGNIISFFKTPERLYAAGKYAWLESGYVSLKTADNLINNSLKTAVETVEICRRNGWHIVTPDSEEYPERLKEIHGYPMALYVWGDPTVFSSDKMISLVGTRNATAYGRQAAERLAGELALADAVVVSGGAMGIDSAAHMGAIENGGKTIAFLGCGLGSDYLKANEELRRKISENGAVVSEYAPFTPPTKHTFPIRNRLISGIGLGTVVIEAGYRSGSLITAKFALDQGRDVFAVPGEAMGTRSLGTNSLIRDGARSVFSVMDILDGYSQFADIDSIFEGDYLPLGGYLNKKSRMGKKRAYIQPKSEQLTWNIEASADNTVNVSDTRSAGKKTRVSGESEKKSTVEKQEEKQKNECDVLPYYASAEAEKLFSVMGGEPATVDELVFSSAMTVQNVLASLTELELYGIIEMNSGKRYSLKNEN